MSSGLRSRRAAKALRLELTAIYVEKEFSPEWSVDDASAPTNPTPWTVRDEHVDAVAQLQEQREADSRTAMRPPVMEPSPCHTTTASRKVEGRSDHCVEETGAQEGPSNGGERDRARDNVALEDITLHARALEHDVHILPSERPPLNETPTEEAARKFGCRTKELETIDKRWLFCGFVWIKTGKPRPRSVFGIQWCRRLLFMDGVGGIHYISEYRAGSVVSVCNKGSIRAFSEHVASEELEPRPGFVPPLPSIKVIYDGNPAKDRGAGCVSPGAVGESARVQRRHFWFVTENSDAMGLLYNLLGLHRLRDKSVGGVLGKVRMMSSYAVDGALNKARKFVSGNRRRFVDADYDLDLTYITTRIIAMAFPGVDSVGEFAIAVRNDMKVVKRFLQERHAGRYKVYNLCAEKTYSEKDFGGHVEWIPVLDHQPPTLRQLKAFCSSVQRWMLMHPDNVIAVHCKGGKGRTGMMVSAFLAFAGVAKCAESGRELKIESAEAALQLFHQRRTLNPAGASQGVTGISQLRYMDFFEQSLRANLIVRRAIEITQVTITTIPKIEGEKFFIPVIIIRSSASSKMWMLGARERKTPGRWCACTGKIAAESDGFLCGSSQQAEIDFSKAGVQLSEDFRVELHNGYPNVADQEESRIASNAVAFGCYHTSLAEEDPLVFSSDEVDRGYAFKKHKDLLSADFCIKIQFQSVRTALSVSPNVARNLSRGDSGVSLRKKSMSIRAPSRHDISGDTPQRSPMSPDTPKSAPPSKLAKSMSVRESVLKSGSFRASRGSLHSLSFRRTVESAPSSKGNGEEMRATSPTQSGSIKTGVGDTQYLIFNVDVEAQFWSILGTRDRHHIDAGTVLIADGSQVRTLYLVAAGSLRVEKMKLRGVSVLESLVGVHEIVNVIPFLLPGIASVVDVVANQESEIRSFSASEIAAVFGSHSTSLLYHYICIELSKILIRALAQLRRQNVDKWASNPYDFNDEKSFAGVSVSPFDRSEESCLAPEGSAWQSFSRAPSGNSQEFSGFSSSAKDGRRDWGKQDERQSKLEHIANRLQMPISELVTVTCACRARNASGLIRGSGMLKATNNYLVFESQGFFGRSAAIRLDNVVEARIVAEDGGAQRLLLTYVRCTVARDAPSLDTENAMLELLDAEGRCRNFVARLCRCLKSQMHVELALKDQAQSKDAVAQAAQHEAFADGQDSFSNGIKKHTSKTRLPLLDLFSPVAGVSNLRRLKPGQSLSSKLDRGTQHVCCVWQGAAVGSVNGSIVRRAEFGDLMFLEEFLEPARASQERLAAATMAGAPLVVASISFENLSAILETDHALRQEFYQHAALDLALHLHRLGTHAYRSGGDERSQEGQKTEMQSRRKMNQDDLPKMAPMRGSLGSKIGFEEILQRRMPLEASGEVLEGNGSLSEEPGWSDEEDEGGGLGSAEVVVYARGVGQDKANGAAGIIEQEN